MTWRRKKSSDSREIKGVCAGAHLEADLRRLNEEKIRRCDVARGMLTRRPVIGEDNVYTPRGVQRLVQITSMTRLSMDDATWQRLISSKLIFHADVASSDWLKHSYDKDDREADQVWGYSLWNKKKRFESFVPVSDTLLEKARQEQEHVTVLDPKSRAAGTETPWSQTLVTDLTVVGEGRGTVLSLKLDRLSDSVSGLTIIDPKGCLTDLKSMKITSDAEISDIKKVRLLLKSVAQTNPKHPPGWIVAARLEEVAGKIQVARQLMQRGCEESPNNEDVWLEAKGVIARGIKWIPNSVKLWMHAAKLEHDDANKSRVLMKGLEHIPDSVRLWKAVVELANENEAEAAERAQSVATRHVIIQNTIGIGVEDLDRKRTWVADAEECKRRGSIETTHAIYNHALTVFRTKKSEVLWPMGAKEKWLAGEVDTARAILGQAYAAIPNSEEILLAAIRTESRHGNKKEFDILMARQKTLLVGCKRFINLSKITCRRLLTSTRIQSGVKTNVKHLVPYYGDTSDDDNSRANSVHPGENDEVQELACKFLIG
ncbi:hypothetical protein Syun_023580 [Stephania yunnanensis]|uniref:PRP1 splicing factor N-terminal domain-containing protein n=1 Tax=Stephania yunnanensis TaxID=152371 RepID=A0AAP0F9W9_9MAGN